MQRLAAATGLALTVACSAAGTPSDPGFPLSTFAGAAPGPQVALVAGVHGGKRAAVRALDSLATLLPGRLTAGRVLILAPANVAGFTAGAAQTSPDDGLNLNRVFPGDSSGSPTQRLAARILREIVSGSDYLVDLHGSDGDEAVGAFAYAARPGLAPRVDSAARSLAEAWGVPVVVWDDAGPRVLAESRFLQTAAHLSGVPAITVFEAGSRREDPAATRQFVVGALRLLASLGMLDADAGTAIAGPEVLPRRAVTTAPLDAAWVPTVSPGAILPAGAVLGTLVDSVGARRTVRSDVPGVVLHQRLASPVRAGTPLVILGMRPGVRLDGPRQP